MQRIVIVNHFVNDFVCVFRFRFGFSRVRTKVRREALCVQETRAEKGRDTDHVLIQLHPDKIKPSKTKSFNSVDCQRLFESQRSFER